MTNRARWLLFVGLVGLFGGVLRGQGMLSLLSLTVLVWVLVQWVRFQVRVHFELPRLKFERLVNGRGEATGSLWVGRRVQIELQVSGPTVIRPIIQIRDIVPEILELLAPHIVFQFATEQAQGQCGRDARGPGAYSAQEECGRDARGPSTDSAHEQCGRDARGPDRRSDIQFIKEKADSQGRVARVLKSREWLTARSKKKAAVANPLNSWTLNLPCKTSTISYAVVVRAAGQVTLPGVHLTLLDPFGFFQMHRFVPLKQTFRLLPDFFQSGELRPTVKRQNALPQHGIHRLQRAGTGAELLELREYVPGDPPKSIAWKASARRDKLMTRKYESEVPVRVHLFLDGSFSTRVGGHGLRLLDQLNFVAASVARAAISVGDPVSGMLVNETGEKRLPWLTGDRGFMQLLKALAEFSQAAPPLSHSLTPYLMQCALRVCHERFPELLERRYQPLPFSFWAATRERYRIAGVLSEVFELSPNEQVECVYDNQLFARYLHEFLHNAGLPWMAPMIATPPDPGTGGVQRMQILADAMSLAIAHARDNEVFVVLADLLSCAPNLNQLLRVVKLALAKHHRVAFVCPTTTFIRPSSAIIAPKSESIPDLMFAAEQARVRDLAAQMKRELVRLGVTVAFAGERSAIQMIISEMDLARDGRSLLQGVRS